METSVLSHSTESLEEVFSLGLAGLAKDADRKGMLWYLQKLLDADVNTVVARLKSSRDRLVSFSTRDEARQHQLRLGDMGCVMMINAGWKVGRWIVNADMPELLEQRIDAAEQQGLPQVIALLQADTDILDADPQEVCASISGQQCVRVAEREFLVFCATASAKGAASWLKTVSSKFSLALKDSPKFTSTVAICPEDGRTLADVYASFDAHINGHELKAAPDMKTFAVPANLWPIAGSAWREALAVGEADMVASAPEAVADFPKAYWPADPDALSDYHGAVASGGAQQGRNILRNFSLGTDARRLMRGRILQKVRSMREIPTLPVMAMQAYQLAQSPDSNASELAQFVEREPALSARILSVVNSPYFGLNAPVESIKHALVLLGWEEIAHLALLLSSKAVFSRMHANIGQDLWRHAALAAEVSRHLAPRVPMVNASRMYTASLLHDVGKVCLYLVAAEEMQDCTRLAKEAQVPTYEMERERMGLDHAEVSGMLLRHWGLPEQLCCMIERHHGCWPGEQQIELDCALLGLIDHVTHRIEGSELAGDLLRIHRVHANKLEPFFGEFSLVSTDLLADDLQPALRSVAA